VVTKRSPEADRQTLRVFVAGASGTIGRRLLPLLVEAGHEVIGSTHSREKATELAELGAEPVVMDALSTRKTYSPSSEGSSRR
jgi:nucleoside-diphosphate-sugar epimerase